MKTTSVFISFVLVLVTIAGFGEVKLPRIFSDGMVLQRDRNIPVWGWASAKEKVTVEFNHKQYRTTASAEGNWRIELRAMKAGGPYTMKVTGANTILLNDILVGDVWLCAGQSNMVHQLNIHDVTYANDIASANYPAIRHFKIPTQTDLRGPAKDFNEGSWQRAVSEGVRPFSAVAYFFARQIYEKYKVPIGLINASVGGSPVESWISEQGFKNFPEQLKVIGQNKDTAYVNGLNRREESHGTDRVS